MSNKRRKVKLNVKFNKNKVDCAKSSENCEGCSSIKTCELIYFYYYPYKGWQQCFNNSEKRK